MGGIFVVGACGVSGGGVGLPGGREGMGNKQSEPEEEAAGSSSGVEGGREERRSSNNSSRTRTLGQRPGPDSIPSHFVTLGQRPGFDDSVIPSADPQRAMPFPTVRNFRYIFMPIDLPLPSNRVKHVSGRRLIFLYFLPGFPPVALCFPSSFNFFSLHVRWPLHFVRHDP